MASNPLVRPSPSSPASLPPTDDGAGWRQQVQHLAVRFGRFMFVARNVLFPLVFTVLILTTRPELPFDSERADWWLDVLGILVACVGQSCRALAIGQTENIRRGGKERDGRKKQVFAKQLIQHAVYAHTRNPLYLGNLLIILGLGLIANNLWWYLIMLPGFIGVYWSIVLAEEEYLSHQFGPEYAEYRRSVNRFFPRLTGLWTSCTQYPFDWRRVLRKEYSVACSWLCMGVGLLIWERWERFGYAAQAPQIDDLALGFVAILIFYLSVWRLKAAGKLRS